MGVSGPPSTHGAPHRCDASPFGDELASNRALSALAAALGRAAASTSSTLDLGTSAHARRSALQGPKRHVTRPVRAAVVPRTVTARPVQPTRTSLSRGRRLT